MLTGQHVMQLATNAKGEVVGVEAHDGRRRAPPPARRRAVVFGTGGFTQDRSKVMNYLRGPIFGGCAVPTNTATSSTWRSQRARLGNMRNGFFVQHVLEQALANSSVVDDLWIPPGAR